MSKILATGVPPIETLALRAATKFREDYVNLSREIFASEEAANGLHHAGEFGRYREKLLNTLLSAFLPARLAIGDGFLVSSSGARSTQCDAILYERDATPHIEASGGRAMYPVETCAAVGEAKSVLTFEKVQDALIKLMEIKRMRAQMMPFGMPVAPGAAQVRASLDMDKAITLAEETGSRSADDVINDAIWRGFVPEKVEQQNLVSFLVCEKIKWPEGCKPSDNRFHDALSELYPRKMDDYYLRANFILSLEDGFLSYYSSQKVESEDEFPRKLSYPFPRRGSVDCGWRWQDATSDNHHIVTFASELAIAASSTWIYEFSPKLHSRSEDSFAFRYIPLS